MSHPGSTHQDSGNNEVLVNNEGYIKYLFFFSILNLLFSIRKDILHIGYFILKLLSHMGLGQNEGGNATENQLTSGRRKRLYKL